MSTRLILLAVVLPGLVGLAVMAGVLLPTGDHLSWPRLLAGVLALVTVQAAGGWFIGYWVGRRELRP
ncbi:hypothetical protein ACFWBC_10305 [Streptomyces sp. NPDC059985]|uniref:hypothetical protein n=1 Tax=Streptomyces sp. NPDC059985 TaxID=3347025 RepID=UPI00369127CC